MSRESRPDASLRARLATLPVTLTVTVDVHRILPGKADAWRAVVAELAGPRRVELAESNRRRGVSRMTLSLGSAGGEPIAVIVWEAADPEEARRRLHGSTHAFDSWLGEQMAAMLATGEPAEVLFDSSPRKGPWRGLRRPGS